MNDESGAWLTYAEAGDRLGITPEAARSRAKRLGWRRQLGNDGRALVWAALEPRPPGDRPVTPRSPPGRKPDAQPDASLVRALEAHVATLKEQLAAAEARILKQADELVAYDSAYAGGLAAERAKVEAERARTDKAIAAFSALAERLDALAEERAKPRWRRLAG
jgi:hypothetical protein